MPPLAKTVCRVRVGSLHGELWWVSPLACTDVVVDGYYLIGWFQGDVWRLWLMNAKKLAPCATFSSSPSESESRIMEDSAKVRLTASFAYGPSSLSVTQLCTSSPAVYTVQE